MPKKATWWNYFVNRMAVDGGMGELRLEEGMYAES